MATPPRDSAHQVVHLLVVSGPDKGRMFFLKPKKEARIGRAPSCDLRLTDPGVSARHCVVRSAGDLAFVEDLKSRNGTRVNGETTTTRVLDGNGRLEVGTSVIELNWVATEREVPLGAVTSPGAPTLLNDPGATLALRRPEVIVGSTIVGAQQLQELRRAEGLLGNTVGDYMLLEVLGVGGMGFVYRAKNVKAHNEVALKLIARAAARTPKLLDRFLKECRTGLQVPGAVRLLATGTDGDFSFLAMDLARGRSLQALVDAGRKLSAAAVAAVVAPVCDTLHAAHAQGLIHRDLKPASILVPDDGAPVLLDLGVAKKTDAEGRSIIDKSDRLESAAFNSPELTREVRSADGRADVYSLAATAFFALTGQRPFTAATHIELVRKIRWESPPLLTGLRPDTPPALSGVIGSAMEKEPERRYADVRAFAAAFQAALSPGA